MGKLFQKKGKQDWTLHNLAMEVTRVTAKQRPQMHRTSYLWPPFQCPCQSPGRKLRRRKRAVAGEGSSHDTQGPSSGDVDQVGMVL